MGRVLRRFFRPLAKFAVFSWDRTDAGKICGRIAKSFVDGEHRRRDFLYPIWLLPAMPASAVSSHRWLPGITTSRPSDNSPREILKAGSGRRRNAQARNGSGEHVRADP